MNPGKNDNVYIGKTNGSLVYEQKRYLPIRDILEILNGNSLSEESTLVSTFDTKLSFSLFYCFLKMHKQYIYNSKILHNSCLCEICENASLLGKGLDNGSKRVQIPTDTYSNWNHNEIHTAYFGNNSFSLFTVCAFYINQGKTEKVSVTITTEVSDKSRVTCISCVDFLIQFPRSKIEKEIDTIHIFFQIDARHSFY